MANRLNRSAARKPQVGHPPAMNIMKNTALVHVEYAITAIYFVAKYAIARPGGAARHRPTLNERNTYQFASRSGVALIL